MQSPLDECIERQTRLYPEWVGLIGPSHHDFGAGGAYNRRRINFEAENIFQNAVLMSVNITQYADQPSCNHLWMSVVRDKQDFI